MTEAAEDRDGVPEPLARLDVNGVLMRLRSVYDVPSDTELARALGVPQSTVGSWKQRGSIPLNVILLASSEISRSLDWIVYGRGVDLGGSVKVDPEVLVIAIESALASAGIAEPDAIIVAERSSELYAMFSRQIDTLVKEHGLSTAQSKKVIIGTVRKLRANSQDKAATP